MQKKRLQTENAGIQRNNEKGSSTEKETLTTPHKGNWEKHAVRCTRRQKCWTVSQNAHEASCFIFSGKKTAIPVIILTFS